jgi:hypothetical protein
MTRHLFPVECDRTDCLAFGNVHALPHVTEEDVTDSEIEITERDVEVPVTERDRAWLLHVEHGAPYDACWDCNAE